MSFVVDSSVVASWCFGDEVSASAEAAFARLAAEEAIAPSLLWFEVRNALYAGERRNRLTRQIVDEFLSNLDPLPIRLEPLPASAPVMALTRRYSLSVYDAAYLELAWRTGLPLASLDRALIDAARAEGIDVL